MNIVEIKQNYNKEQLKPLLSAIDAHMTDNHRTLVAIDGRCAAGKTTLAGLLHKIYTCPIVPMDRFFLQSHQRTSERLAQAGGNVDYERFAVEVLAPLTKGQPCVYRPYDCATDSLKSPIELPTAPKLVVIEGSYSLHPALADSYDIKVLLQVSPEEQLRRLQQRESPEKLKRFVEEWIPLEERYFSQVDIAQGRIVIGE